MKMNNKKKVLDSDTNIVKNKRKKSHSVTCNKKYESINIVPETGDSIYSPQYEEFTTLDDRGQAYYSETRIVEIVKRMIDQRLGPSLNNDKNDH